MKLNLHPKEFLALYNVLQNLRANDPVKAGTEEAALQEVFNRMRSCIISALTKRGDASSDDELMDLWEKGQKEKIAELEAHNEQLKAAVRDKGFLVLHPEEADEVVPPYPRKGPPQPNMPKPGKFRGKK